MEKITNIRKSTSNLREFGKSKYKKLQWDCNPEKNKLFLNEKINGALKIKSLAEEIKNNNTHQYKVKGPFIFRLLPTSSKRFLHIPHK